MKKPINLDANRQVLLYLPAVLFKLPSKYMRFSQVIFFIFSAALTGSLWSQSLVDQVSAPANTSNGLFFETIEVISNSKKIFILSNNNDLLNPGDFISLLLDQELAARALVAKSYDGKAGIKIMKIYSLKNWNQLSRGLSIAIIRGDDSYYKKPEEKLETDEAVPKIESEEDLFNSKVSLDLDEFQDDKKRNIKPDNIVGISLGYLDVDDGEGGTIRSQQFSGAWAFQFNDNYFAEASYGRTLIDDYPSAGIQTLVNNFSIRLKYNFKAPLYSFIMPYVGFQTQTVSSPDAGQNTTSSQAARELAQIDQLKKNSLAVGLTVLRRLVPGWFLTANIGTDALNIGVAIEF